ncbi:MAG: hypothetical protein KAR42_17865 [candidate division Zixibacteria bacterium]|nr:hypothetical protein [candidate division Zixibacteria bacterium]
MKREFKYGAIVEHKPTGSLYIIDCSSEGIRYSDGERYWYNVVQIWVGVSCIEDKLSAKEVHLTALPEDELTLKPKT